MARFSCSAATPTPEIENSRAACQVSSPASVRVGIRERGGRLLRVRTPLGADARPAAGCLVALGAGTDTGGTARPVSGPSRSEGASTRPTRSSSVVGLVVTVTPSSMIASLPPTWPTDDSLSRDSFASVGTLVLTDAGGSVELLESRFDRASEDSSATDIPKSVARPSRPLSHP